MAQKIHDAAASAIGMIVTDISAAEAHYEE
jgi:hypothetical protein